jgi:putative tricarboxylic transport membrane protein
VEVGARRRSLPWGDLLVAVGVLGLGGFFLEGALSLRVLPSYARIGPRFFPVLVGVALSACGAALLVQALRGVRGVPEEAEDAEASAATDWAPVAVIVAALALHALLVSRLGFVLSSALLYAGVALGFGERRLWRSGAVGLVLALAAYLAFTRLLGLRLPAGVLPL